MIDKMFYDEYAERYTIETSRYAPPERYVLVKRSELNKYVEKWEIVYQGKENYLDIEYSESDYYNEENHKKIVSEAIKDYEGIQMVRVVEWTIPATVFDSCIEMFNLEKKEE